MFYIIYFIGIIIPFIGNLIGSLLALFIKRNKYCDILCGISSGIMLASSIWSLINPALEMVDELKIIGLCGAFLIGIIIFMIIDKRLNKNNMYISITAHNIPEGMIVGISLSAAFLNSSNIMIINAIVLAIGIGIQNIPESIVTSLSNLNENKKRAFWYGILSGLVEPIFATISFFMAYFVSMLLPYLLMLAAAAMIYVIVMDLIPEMKNNYSIIFFAIGFLLMMVLDVIL